MKKQFLSFIIIAASVVGAKAQSEQKWTTNGNAISGSDVIGTSNNNPLIFIVNGSQVARFKQSGEFKINNLKANNNRMLFADTAGILTALPQGNSSQVLFGNGVWGALPEELWQKAPSGVALISSKLYVGIGNENPQYNLDVTGNVHISTDLIVNNGITLGPNNVLIKAGSDGVLLVEGNTQFQGSSSVGQNLFVNGNTSVAGSLSTNSLSIASLAGGSSDYNEVFVDANGNLKQTQPTGTPLPNCGNGNPSWRLGGNSIASYQNAVFGTCDKDLTFEAGGYHSMLLTATGYLGIGNPFATTTNSPNAMLDIIPAGSTAAFNVGNSSGTSFFNITSAGKVGIGNANPNAIVDLSVIAGSTPAINISNIDLGLNLFTVANNGNITAQGLASGAVGTAYSGLLIDANGNIVKASASISSTTTSWNLGGNGSHLGAVAGSIGTTDANDLPIVTNNIERMRISNATGNVGIGTTYPASQLDILASGTNAGLNINNISTGSIFSVANNGSSIIGGNGNASYSATKMLTVNGDVSLANYNSINSSDPHANDGFSGIEILGNNGVPTRRGLSVDADPNGDFNFYLNSNQSSSEFNFMNGNGNTKLVTIASNGQTTILTNSSTMSDALLINDIISGTPVNHFKVKSTGQVYAREVIVSNNAFPDYVFNNNYKLMPLSDVEKYINENKHLPNIPSAKEVEGDGQNLGDLQVKQMEKIEELTLYLIEIKKEIENLKKENKDLKNIINNK